MHLVYLEGLYLVQIAGCLGLHMARWPIGSNSQVRVRMTLPYNGFRDRGAPLL